jgi:hypothetical protein
MARGDRKLFGVVRRTSDGRRWRIDVRPSGWIHGLAGVSFGDDRAMAEAVLNVIRVKIAQGVPRDEAVAGFLPVVADAHRIAVRYAAWLDHMDGLVEVGDRSPQTIREYRRYARQGGELAWWGAESLAAVTEGGLESWSQWMALDERKRPEAGVAVLVVCAENRAFENQGGRVTLNRCCKKTRKKDSEYERNDSLHLSTSSAENVHDRQSMCRFRQFVTEFRTRSIA